MNNDTGNTATESPVLLGEGWFDPIEMGIREQIRGFIETLVDEELNEALGRALPAARRGGGHRDGRGNGRIPARRARSGR